MWQWVDDVFGPMGWFSDEEKEQHEKEFVNGHWRQIPEEERQRMAKNIASLAYEQA